VYVYNIILFSYIFFLEKEEKSEATKWLRVSA